MQVTETLSDGLKRSYAVTVPAAEIEGKTKSQAGRDRPFAAPARLPARQACRPIWCASATASR